MSTGTGTDRPRLVAAFDHSIPVLQGLYRELARVSDLRTVDTEWRWRARLRDDASMPATLYLPPRRAALGWRKSALQALLRDSDCAVLSRPDHALWLPMLGAKPFVYHAIDDYLAYEQGWAPRQIDLLRGARHVVAVSTALARKLASDAGLPAERVSVLPNAVDASWIPPKLPAVPWRAARNAGMARRPMAGVLGRVSSRLRLDWLAQAVRATPWLDWVLAGDVERGELLSTDRPHLEDLRAQPNCRITGRLPFERMRDLAAALDVAVLPYSDRSTNPLGSPVRLFVHLPMGTPLMATPGCLQLEEFDPLVCLCDSADALIDRIETLRFDEFDDGLREQRWALATEHSWTARARQMRAIVLAATQATA